MTSHNIANFTMKSSSLHLLIALGVYEVLVNATSDSPPPPCSSYNIDSKVLELEPPTLNPNSAIGQVFEALEGQLQAVLVPQPTGPACYEWTCQSNERKGENCRWCLPAIFVGGKQIIIETIQLTFLLASSRSVIKLPNPVTYTQELPNVEPQHFVINLSRIRMCVFIVLKRPIFSQKCISVLLALKNTLKIIGGA